MEGHSLHFGRQEFSLIIGFCFGTFGKNIKAWNSFPWVEHLWCHLYDEIKNLRERHGDEDYYGLFKDRNYVPTYTWSSFVFAFQEKARKRGKTDFMVSSIGETTDNIFRKKWLNNLVIMELNFRLFKLETIIQVIVHERSDRQAKLKFTDELSSMKYDLCDSLNSMFADLIEPANLDEDIAQDLRMCLEGEEKMRCEHQKLIVEENRIRLDV
nr:phospholipase-like protein [Tanacetum cinerariifolium]